MGKRMAARGVLIFSLTPALLTMFWIGLLHGPCRADNWLGRDKFEHFSVSAAMAAATGFVTYNHFEAADDEAVTIGFSISLTLGGIKEIIDANLPGADPSAKDLVADLAGALAGAVFLSAIITQ